MRLAPDPCAICRLAGKGARWRFVLSSRRDSPAIDSFSVHKRCYRDAASLVAALNQYLDKHPHLFFGEVRSED